MKAFKIGAYLIGGLILCAFGGWAIGTLIGGPAGGQLGGKIGGALGVLAGLGFGAKRGFA